ncbi:MAG: NADH-quinone oxidoreductase subunit J [Candidatus Tectomicrobia bacterium]|uniref:NADH-quinone oxidoreductase subunit J n=1 Tax=Tectimicrobiota bacterium TaxID=2528274 RepID=A0A932CRJ1_UNCTE|nr:NADH-quinone oxidoreductase subunit J [Candidatus Tectomicrobia bacterium]
MNLLFYASAIVSVIAGILVITRRNAMHALLYLILLFLAIALMLFTLGAPFVAALQIIVYAGAILVLFVFAVMLLNLGPAQEEREREWLSGGIWILPLILAAILLGLTVYALSVPAGPGTDLLGKPVGPKEVGLSLFQKYVLGVELASLLLLAGLVSAFHLGIFLRGGGMRSDGDRTV